MILIQSASTDKTTNDVLDWIFYLKSEIEIFAVVSVDITFRNFLQQLNGQSKLGNFIADS